MKPIEIMVRALREVDDRPILLTPVAEHLRDALQDAGYVIVGKYLLEDLAEEAGYKESAIKAVLEAAQNE